MPPPARSPASGPRRRFLLLPLLLLPLLLLLHLISSPPPRPLPAPRKPAQACDYSAGEWVRDASAGPAPRYDHTCKEIFKGWNCIANGKGNGRDLLRWRWRPSGAGCELPRLDPRWFLERHRDSSIGQAAAPVISPKKGPGRSSPVPLSPRRRRPRSTHLAGEGSFGVGHGRVASANPAPARRRDAGEEDEGDGGSSAGAAAPDSTAPQRRAALRRDAGGAMAAGETQAGHSSSTPKVRDERQREGSMREGDDDDSAQYGARRLGIGEGCGFVGDSLNRNMFVSLVCMLRGVSGEVRKWRPAGADRGFTFLRYNLTVAYHRTNLLVRYGRWSASPNGGPLESLGYKQGYRVDVDIPDQTWVEACSFHDVLIFNTGHWWWAPSKFDPMQSPMLFFEKGKPVVPPLLPSAGLDLALQHMITFVNKAMRPNALKFFRTQSPRHFEGGDWNEGGSCQRNQPLSAEEVEEFFSLDYNGTNIEARLVNKHLMKALEQSTFRVLDITHMSELRADAHPSTTGGKKHDDCMHWCLPGLTDTWNDLLAVNLEGVDS